MAFSFISITTGIFTTFGFAISTGGPRSIWTWPIVIVGQALVALVYGALAARVPLSGYSYQWASRLANVHVGWWLGWMSFAFLSIVTVSVDYGLVQVAFQPLIGQAYTPTSAALETLVVLALQAALIIWSTRITTRVNNTAVATELIGILGLTVLLIVVAAIRGLGHWSNLTSTGTVPATGYYAWLGPFMLATLLGAYTIVGLRVRQQPGRGDPASRTVIPRAMVRAVLVSGVVGMVFLIALAYAISVIPAATKSSAPVAFIVNDVLGGVVQKLFLIFVVISIFACGLIIMVTNSRLIWSMSRDRRLPGYQLWRQVPRATGGPSWATLLAAVIGAAITLVLRTHTSALVTLFTASTIMPALLYASTVVLYIFTGRRRRGEAGHFSLGRWEIPVIAGALIWLAYELIILIGPSEFRDAQYYVLGALGVGLVVYIGQWLLEPYAMRTEQGAHGAEALEAAGQAAPAGPGGPSPATGTPPGDGGPAEPLNILAIDQGTSATKALVIGPGQQVLGTGEVPVGCGPWAPTAWRPTRRSSTGRWSRPARRRWPRPVPRRTRSRWPTRARPSWPGTGGPAAADPGHRLAGPAVVRACERLAGSGPAGPLTGLRLDPYFAAPKMTWLRENLSVDGVVTTTDTWLLARLGAGYVTDAATASRTLLLDLDRTDWSAEACAIVRPGPGGAAGGGRLRRGRGRDRGVRARGAGGRAGGRPAGRAAGRALLRRGRGQVHVRDRRVPARDHRGQGRALGQRPGRVDSLAAGRGADYCLDGQVYTAGAAIRWLVRSACSGMRAR